MSIAKWYKLPTVRVFDEVGNKLIRDIEQMFLAAIWNSFVIDAMLRLKVTTTVNFFYIYQLPIPRLSEQDAAFWPIVERAARLICTTPKFADLWQAVMGPDRDGAADTGPTHRSAPTDGDEHVGADLRVRPNAGDDMHIGVPWNAATDPAERARLRAELDGIIAHLYGLTEAEFVHILGTFPLVAQETKDAALDAFRLFAPNPDDHQVAALIAQGEGARLEFKIGALVNPFNGQKDSSMKETIVQEVAAFMNTEGGTLLVGVKDDGTITGVAHEYAVTNPNKRNRDGYALWLTDAIGNRLGNDVAPLFTITIHHVDGHDICRIHVEPALRPVYVDGDLYIRVNNSKKKLNAQEAHAYRQQRWGM